MGGFLKAIMDKIDFDSKWVDIIMRCISKTFYSMLVNRSRGKRFQPTKAFVKEIYSACSLFAMKVCRL